MQSQNRFFDDMARVASGAVGALTGVRGEIEARFRDQLERILTGMDLVSREEFEAVKQWPPKHGRNRIVIGALKRWRRDGRVGADGPVQPGEDGALNPSGVPGQQH